MEVKDAERQFVEAARLHGFHSLNGGPVETNAAYDKVVSALRSLRTEPDRGQGFLLSCLANSDPSIVTWAALYLLPLKESEAVGALERVARSDARLIRLDAEMTLEQWREGRLKIE